MSQVNIEAIVDWLNEQLKPESFKDYAPNGLQVQGKQQVSRIICGVTASQALLDEAVRQQADAVIVHHGWFWKNEDSRIIGSKYRRMATIIKHDINLIAYHLPLDAHPVLGNNACLSRLLEFEPLYVEDKQQHFGDQDLGWLGRPLKDGLTAGQLYADIEDRLHRKPLFIGDPDQVLRKIAWCTGGAQSFLEAAIAQGADAFITGEASEQVCHLARENNLAYFGAGHHATERYGVQALGNALQEKFPSLNISYAEIPNPV